MGVHTPRAESLSAANGSELDYRAWRRTGQSHFQNRKETVGVADSPVSRKALLSPDVLIEKARLGFECLFRFREVEPVPKRMRHCVEDHQPSIHSCPKKSAMKVDRAAETVIAGRSHAESRREPFEIGIHRRKHGVLAVVVTDVGNHPKSLERFDHRAEICEAACAIKEPRVTVSSEIGIP